MLLVQAEKGDDKEGKQLLQKCMGKVGVFLIITIALVWSRISKDLCPQDLPYEFQLKNTVRPELVAEVPKKQKRSPESSSSSSSL